jgi:hypothetical protein
MADRVWKRREREVAKTLKGRRIPVTGIDRHGADVETPLLSIQVKHGRRRPAFLREWLDGICGSAKVNGKVGLVVWTDHREPTPEAVVILKLSDFEALHGSLAGVRAVPKGA